MDRGSSHGPRDPKRTGVLGKKACESPATLFEVKECDMTATFSTVPRSLGTPPVDMDADDRGNDADPSVAARSVFVPGPRGRPHLGRSRLPSCSYLHSARLVLAPLPDCASALRFGQSWSSTSDKR